MRIEQSTVALSSQRRASTTDSTRASMQAWVGDRPSQALTTAMAASGRNDLAAITRISSQALATVRASAEAASRLAASRSAIAAAGRQLLASASLTDKTIGASAASDDAADPTISDPNLSVLVLLIERLIGRKIHLIRPGDVATDASATAAAAGQRAARAVAASQGDSQPAAQTAGWGVAVHVEQVHQETETTAYSATGTVKTADGQTMTFAFQVSMHREETQTATLDILAGDAARKVDPIALNLGGGPVTLSATRTAFDVDGNGAVEQVALPAAGTYFLALDRNGNGVIDGGAELFGPSSGDGFAELRALDDDGNGWIDEADHAFASLQLWSGPDAQTASLSNAGVGALYVGASVGTQFEVKAASGESLGQVVSSSVYLAEDGTPGALQQVDLTA
jgi:hypothetical protein